MTQDNTRSALKPCPFCGSHDIDPEGVASFKPEHRTAGNNWGNATPDKIEHRVTSRADGFGYRDCSCGGTWKDEDEFCSTLTAKPSPARMPTSAISAETFKQIDEIIETMRSSRSAAYITNSVIQALLASGEVVLAAGVRDDVETIRNVAGDLDEGIFKSPEGVWRRRGNVGGIVTRACDRILALTPTQEGIEE